jgi:cytochrome c-type biogenesis protein CcmE
MKPRQKRLILVIGGVTSLAVAGMFVLNAFRSNLVYFLSPTEVYAGKAPPNGTFRVGGLVEQGSLIKQPDSLKVAFTVTDLHKKMRIEYEGILPDLFREGQGVIAQGRLAAPEVFRADEVLAKHDEKYMPPEVAKALKDSPAAASTVK